MKIFSINDFSKIINNKMKLIIILNIILKLLLLLLIYFIIYLNLQ